MVLTCSISEKQIGVNLKLANTNGAIFWKQQMTWSTVPVTSEMTNTCTINIMIGCY